MASIFLSLGILGGISRVCLEIQEKQAQEKAANEVEESFAKLGSSLGALLGSLADNSEDKTAK